jgi:hypothetical protein
LPSTPRPFLARAETLKIQLGQRFGIRSCLQYIKHSDESLPLNAIVEDEKLNQSEWIRIAKVRVAESLFLERVLQTTRDVLLPAIPGVP